MTPDDRAPSAHSRPVLTIDDLAERWSITPGELKRRMGWLRLPAVNIGSQKAPMLRFLLAKIEEWERANCFTMGEPKSAGGAVLTGAPPGLDGFDSAKVKFAKGRR